MEEKEPFYEHIERINQIDALLEDPIKTLIALTERCLEDRNRDPFRGTVRLPLYFPPWLAPDRDFQRAGMSVTSATCCSTLQRVWRRRRRFPRLEKDLERIDKLFRETDPDTDRSLPDLLARAFLPPREEGDGRYLRFLREIDLLGPHKPLLACEVLWTLINAGEGDAYTGVGHIAFFAIFWSLLSGAGPANGGVAIGLSPPTAFVTARCLLPIYFLSRSCVRRADLLKEIREVLRSMDELMTRDEWTQKRELAFMLDKLTTILYDYAEITLARRSFRDCARKLDGQAGSMNMQTDTPRLWKKVRRRLVHAIWQGGRTGARVVAEAEPVMGSGDLPEAENAERRGIRIGLLRRICDLIEARDSEALKKLGVVVSVPQFRLPKDKEDFWDRQHTAARGALELCELAFRALSESYRGCERMRGSDVGTILKTLEQLETANRKVASAIEARVDNAVDWCESRMLSEIAHLSAGNMAEADAAELVSGLAVAVTVKRIDSPIRLGDAVQKALRSAREDGSWTPGQPFLIDEAGGPLGVAAPTAGIIWMLSGAIGRRRAVTAADDALGRYLDWLVATKKSFLYSEKAPDPGDMTAVRREPLKVTGWVSEQTIRLDRIDLWITAFVINSLINIRGLMEFRLWQVCERRFTVLRGGRELGELEAVDLGARQEHRLHRRLEQMARRAESDNYKDADYAIVLHGPPGSSKTVIAQALAKEMWRAPQREASAEPRLIRITPADFTRGGEERLDSEARIIFDILRHVRNVTVLFDEIDDLLRQRNGTEQPSFLKLVVPAMLNRLQDLRDACPKQEIFFVLATNYIERIEPALIRKGRIDFAIPLVYPDLESRLAIIEKRIEKARPVLGARVTSLLTLQLRQDVAKTSFWPWMTLDALCKDVVRELQGLEKGKNGFKVNGLERRLQDGLTRLIDTYGSSVPPIPYRDRLEKNVASVELRNGFLSYLFAASGDLPSYRNTLSEILSGSSLPRQLIDLGERFWREQGRL